MKAAMIGKGLLWLLCLALLVLVLLVSGSLWALGLLAVIALLPFASLIWNGTVKKKLQAKLMLPAGARKHSRVQGNLQVSCRGPAPLGRVYGRIELQNDLTGEQAVLSLPLEQTDTGYEAYFELYTAHCGGVRVTVRELVLTDFFGFLPMPCKADAEGRLTVLPDTFPVEIDAAMRTAPSDGDDSRDDRKGSDMTETFQLREYQPGDNLHGIHWKLSGKLDKLIYREPAQPVSNALLLFWDQSSGTSEQMDTLAEAVFSVGQSLCEQGVPFTVGKNEHGEIQTAEITGQDGLIEHFPILLRRRGANRQALSELAGFGRVFYFTAEIPDRETNDAVQIFLCSDGTGTVDNAIVFTPDNASEVLERLNAYGA